MTSQVHMDERQTLPPEVILLIVECAALREAQDPLHLGWAASLCLVCRSFRRVVTPLLYAHVVVTEENLDRLALLARDAPAALACTRSATFLGGRLFRPSLQPLIRAMTRLTAFTGREFIFDYIDEDLTIPSIFLTDITPYLDVSLFVQKATRLHIVIMLVGDPDAEFFESDLPVSPEYLMIDVLADRESAWRLHTPEFLRHVDSILDSQQALRRILLRPRCLHSGFTGGRFYSEVEEWGKTQRDSRIWIHDIVAPSFTDENGTDVYEALYLQDALAGDELWLTGRQLCHA